MPEGKKTVPIRRTHSCSPTSTTSSTSTIVAPTSDSGCVLFKKKKRLFPFFFARNRLPKRARHAGKSESNSETRNKTRAIRQERNRNAGHAHHVDVTCFSLLLLLLLLLRYEINGDVPEGRRYSRPPIRSPFLSPKAKKTKKTKEKRWNETKNPRRRNGRPAFQGRRFIKKQKQKTNQQTKPMQSANQQSIIAEENSSPSQSNQAQSEPIASGSVRDIVGRSNDAHIFY